MKTENFSTRLSCIIIFLKLKIKTLRTMGKRMTVIIQRSLHKHKVTKYLIVFK